MTAIAFRYDFAEDEQSTSPLSIISEVLQEYYPGTLGIERHNKYGEEIKRHFHYHFFIPLEGEKEVDKWIEKCRKRMMRRGTEDKKRGRGYYSITAPRLKDRDSWLRYCYKQVPTVSEIFRNPRIVMPDDFDVELQWKLATEEYIRDRDFLSSRREKQDRRQTTFEKIIEAIDSEGIQFLTIRDIFNYILQYFKDNVIPVERHKIQGMVDSIALRCGLLSADEYFRLVMK